MFDPRKQPNPFEVLKDGKKRTVDNPMFEQADADEADRLAQKKEERKKRARAQEQRPPPPSWSYRRVPTGACGRIT